MAKINIMDSEDIEITTQNEETQDKCNKILNIIDVGLKDINILADINNKVNLTSERVSKTNTDNSIKLKNAETDAQKEKNRHDEEMAKIENEWKKISDAAADRDRRLSFIQCQIEKFQAEYEKYMALETREFLNDTVTSRLESLRKVIMELTKELNKT